MARIRDGAVYLDVEGVRMYCHVPLVLNLMGARQKGGASGIPQIHPVGPTRGAPWQTSPLSHTMGRRGKGIGPRVCVRRFSMPNPDWSNRGDAPLAHTVWRSCHPLFSGQCRPQAHAISMHWHGWCPMDPDVDDL